MNPKQAGRPFVDRPNRSLKIEETMKTVKTVRLFGWRESTSLPAILTMMAACLVLPPASLLAADQPAITISGGGVGEFLDPNPCDGFKEEGPFGESNFAVSANIYQDGSVSGTFMCQVKGCVVIVQGVFTEVLGIDRADEPGDQDTVFLRGVAAFVDLSQAAGGPGLVLADANGTPYLFEFCLELREGPGTGMKGVPPGTPPARFFYTDEVVLLGGPACLGLDDGYDEEEIRSGHIQIRFDPDVADIPFDRVADCPVVSLPCE